MMRTNLVAMLAGLLGALVVNEATHSPIWCGLAAGVAFAATMMLDRGRSVVGAGSGGSEPDLDPETAGRATAGRLALACLTAVMLAVSAVSVAQAADLTASLTTAAVTMLVAGIAFLGVSPMARGTSTPVVTGIVFMLLGQLIAAGAETSGRRLVGVGLVAAGWGFALAGLQLLELRRMYVQVAAVAGLSVVAAGLLMHAGGYALGVLTPVLLLTPAIVSTIWAELTSMAADRYLGGAPRRARRRRSR